MAIRKDLTMIIVNFNLCSLGGWILLFRGKTNFIMSADVFVLKNSPCYYMHCREKPKQRHKIWM